MLSSSLLIHLECMCMTNEQGDQAQDVYIYCPFVL